MWPSLTHSKRERERIREKGRQRAGQERGGGATGDREWGDREREMEKERE